jgi:Endomembrane protein 70
VLVLLLLLQDVHAAVRHFSASTRSNVDRGLSKCAMPSAADDTEETGWKLLHGDVFRFPPHSNLFAAMVSRGVPRRALFAVQACQKGLLCTANTGRSHTRR